MILDNFRWCWIFLYRWFKMIKMVSRLNKGETRNIGVSWSFMGYSWGFNAIFMGIMIMWDLILEYTNLNQACLFHGHGYIYISYLYPHIFIRSWLMLDPNDQYCWEYTVCMVIKQFAMEKDHWYIIIYIYSNW